MVISIATVIGVNHVSAESVAPVDFNIPDAGLPKPDDAVNLPANALTTTLNWIFFIAGLICIVVIIWAGITYATAGGDEEKVGKAKGRLIYGIIGIAVIIGSYAITQVIYQSINGGGNSLPAPPKL